MAIASFTLDPTATGVPNQIVDKVNAATNQITRANSIVPAARPLGAAEVLATNLAPTVARDNLDAMSDVTRTYIKTSPQAGEFPVIAIQRDSTGKLEVDFDNVAF